MSLSSSNNNIKLWDKYNWDCLLNLTNINKNGEIYSSCFINYNNKNYIATSNYNNLKNIFNLGINMIIIYDINNSENIKI